MQDFDVESNPKISILVPAAGPKVEVAPQKSLLFAWKGVFFAIFFRLRRQLVEISTKLLLLLTIFFILAPQAKIFFFLHKKYKGFFNKKYVYNS